MRAAAILSRNDERMKTKTNSRKGPFQSSGRYLGSMSGTLDSSNIFDRTAKPRSNPRRFKIIPHSPCLRSLSMICSRKGVVPNICSPSLKAGSNANLKISRTVRPVTATQNVCL
ncbi:MAG: hypothetical protein BWY89_01928 [Bacteroidetes bacterium ADurb.BinA012]|nr:MAG: hypothetical protein BWY89_01928 [Bacteroidetes bacterium ADurb.BinA012]